jgi:hypothetical protein
MKRVTYVCDNCGKTVTVSELELEPDGWRLKGLILCDACLSLIKQMIQPVVDNMLMMFTRCLTSPHRDDRRRVALMLLADTIDEMRLPVQRGTCSEERKV